MKLMQIIHKLNQIQATNPGCSHEQIKAYARKLAPSTRQALMRHTALLGDDVLVALSELAHKP